MVVWLSLLVYCSVCGLVVSGGLVEFAGSLLGWRNGLLSGWLRVWLLEVFLNV